ncbi:hypothetical protein L1049_005112 [Liquidambar formosana]|uniref:Uncharacterized protein n=1 Tax=Liquidambar formosana TaxID=63359 RepID=A0AAP0RUI3_LIQFO
MGRRPGGAKAEERAHMPESSNPHLEREGSHLTKQTNCSNLSSSRKRAKNQTVVFRRSVRLRNSVLPALKKDIEPVIEEIDASEREDEPEVHKEKKLPGPALDERNLEEKIDYLFQLLEAQQQTLEALKSKAIKRSFLSQCHCEADVRYKSLYMQSQKKSEALTEENCQLAKKLENALGKVEAFEKGTHVFSEVLEKLKDVILISNVTKATETAINLSSQAILGVSSPGAVTEPITSPAKRKRPAKETGKN